MSLNAWKPEKVLKKQVFKKNVEKSAVREKTMKNAAGRDRGRGSTLSRDFRRRRFRPENAVRKSPGKNAF